MEERLEQALAFSNYRQTLNSQLQKLKIRTEGMLTISKNGGSFTITTSLILILRQALEDKKEYLILLDNNYLPIKIENIEEFHKEVYRRYSQVLEDYHAEYQEIRKARNVKSILDIKDVE